MTLEQWLDQWTRKSVDVQERVQVALQFLQRHYGKTRSEKILGEIRCIDFSHPVSTPTLARGITLVGSKDPRVSPYRSTYFTRSGYPVSRLGVSSSGNLFTRKDAPKRYENLRILDKVLNCYEIVVAIPEGEVLQSVCAPAADTWSIKDAKVLAAGGGLQYLIPRMNLYLRYVG